MRLLSCIEIHGPNMTKHCSSCLHHIQRRTSVSSWDAPNCFNYTLYTQAVLNPITSISTTMCSQLFQLYNIHPSIVQSKHINIYHYVFTDSIRLTYDVYTVMYGILTRHDCKFKKSHDSSSWTQHDITVPHKQIIWVLPRIGVPPNHPF